MWACMLFPERMLAHLFAPLSRPLLSSTSIVWTFLWLVVYIRYKHKEGAYIKVADYLLGGLFILLIIRLLGDTTFLQPTEGLNAL